MAQISNYFYSNINPYLNSLQEKYEFNNIHPYVKNKRFSSNNIFSNYSLFDNKKNELQNINTNNNYNDNNTNINYYDFGPYMNMPLSYELKKEKNYMNKSSEQDLNMMKLQLRCDLIGQKINQIQNQVQNFRESSSKDDKKILKKNRTYGNLNENKNLYRNKNNRKYEDNVYEQKNFFKIPIPRKKEVELSDGFRKKKNINSKRGHNISYINKNISSNYLINDYSNKNGNFRHSFFFNTMNKPNKNKSINGNNRETKNNKIHDLNYTMQRKKADLEAEISQINMQMGKEITEQVCQKTIWTLRQLISTKLTQAEYSMLVDRSIKNIKNMKVGG